MSYEEKKMAKKKISLTSRASIPKSLLNTSNLFDIPPVIKIDFSTAQPMYKTKYVNGEKVSVIKRYRLMGVDVRNIFKLKGKTNIKWVTVDLKGNFDLIEQAINKKEFANITLINPNVRFLHTQIREGVVRKSYKLVADDFKFVE
jgi:hypothetical protein